MKNTERYQPLTDVTASPPDGGSGVPERASRMHIPFGVILSDNTMLSKDCIVSFSQQARVISSHQDESGVTVVTKFEFLGQPIPLTSSSFSVENNG